MTGVVVGVTVGVRVRGKRRATHDTRQEQAPIVSKIRSIFSFVFADTSIKIILLSFAYSSASSLGTSLCREHNTHALHLSQDRIYFQQEQSPCPDSPLPLTPITETYNSASALSPSSLHEQRLSR